MKSMFGDDIPDVPSKRREDRAHAAKPGTGPAGETCRHCLHRVTVEYAKNYQKCGLMRAFWTGGGATDIRCKDPACRMFEPKLLL